MDGRPALTLEAELVSNEGLQVGQELSDERIESLRMMNNRRRCYDTAARYLSYRPRSESELKERLKRRGFEDTTIAAVLVRLKERGLLDDKAFTEFWKDNRQTFSPRSQRLIRLELRHKGVETETINQAVSTIDDGDNAYRAALSRARRLSQVDYDDFYRRLGGYLRRRGFDYAIVKRTVKRTWQELGGRSEDSE